MNHAVHISPDQSFEQSSKVLEVEDIKVHYPGKKDWLGRPISVVRAVDGVTFAVREGESLGLVGESGCGKSTLARAIVNLVKVTAGKVRIDGRDVNTLTASERHHDRRKVQMIFQDPFASLNPRMTVGKIIREPMEIHGMYDRTTRKLEVMRLMDLVGLNLRFMNRYPHEFSGGQRQRVGIARAMASQPKLIICDEAVSALDVSIQAQVINLLMDLQQKVGMAYLFIAHDLAVVRHVADRVGVMYLGRIVELASAKNLYDSPLHPYTRALLSSVPTPDPSLKSNQQRILLSGEVPSPDKIYLGCPFSDRCSEVEPSCRDDFPVLKGKEHQVSCFVHEKK